MYLLRSRISIYLFAVLLLLSTACVEDECSDNLLDAPPLQVNFFEYTNAARTTEKAKEVSFSRVYGYDGSRTSEPMPATEKITSLRLPFSPVSDTTAFIFERANAQPDTLMVSYDRQPTFRSQACGFEIRYTDLAIVRHTFINAEIVQPTAQLANEFRIKIYY